MFKMAMASTACARLSGHTYSSRAHTPDRPHILFITADQHRGDCVHADGNSAITTPNLDAVTTEGARFRHAYTSTPSCIPARAAILTGLSPWRHGLLGMDGWPIPEQYAFELPRALHDAGYYTTSVGKTHFTPARSHGFDEMLVDEHRDIPPNFRTDYHSWFWASAPNIPDPDGCGFGWKDFWNVYLAKPYPFPERLHRTHWVGETAMRFLRTYNRSQPFLLTVSFIPPHSPYVPPRRFFRQYAVADLPRAVVGKWADRYRERSGPDPNIWCGDLGTEQVHDR